MKRIFVYSFVSLITILFIFYLFYWLLQVSNEKRQLQREIFSLNKQLDTYKTSKPVIIKNNPSIENNENSILVNSYEPISKDFPLKTIPLSSNFCDTKKIYNIEIVNTKDELQTFIIKMKSWKNLFDDYSDEIVILNLIELTLLNENISNKINLLYNCNLRDEIKLDKQINIPYEDFNSNISDLTNIITSRFEDLNQKLISMINESYIDQQLLERIESSNFWKNSNNDTNAIWIIVSSILDKQSKEKCINCDEINFGKYHAFLIGLDVYEFAQNLDTPVNDVRELEKILNNKFSFDSVTVFDVERSREEILEQLYSYQSSLTINDNLLIYFGGHGWRNPSTNRGYWLASNSNEKKPYTMISSDDVSEAIRDLDAKQVLVISDSCYSAFMKDKSPNDDGSQNYSLEGLKDRSLDKARRLISSGKDMPVPDSINGSENSLFASILLKELDSVEDVLFAFDLWSNIDKKISYSSYKQEPVYGDIGNLNLEFNGDFIFVAKN